MTNIKDLTVAYVKAFNDKNIDEVLLLVNEDFYLKDPSSEIFDKHEFKYFLEAFFENTISFSGKQIICECNVSVIHFDITVNGDKLSGVDIIEWESSKIKSVIAYL